MKENTQQQQQWRKYEAEKIKSEKKLSRDKLLPNSFLLRMAVVEWAEKLKLKNNSDWFHYRHKTKQENET